MNIDIQKASREEKYLLRNLMELCQHDYSEFTPEDVIRIDGRAPERGDQLSDLTPVIPRVAENLGQHALDVTLSVSWADRWRHLLRRMRGLVNRSERS